MFLESKNNFFKNDYYWMKLALENARKAPPLDVPVGAVIINQNSEILGQAYNQREKNNNLINHAEIIAIQMSTEKLQNWHLSECTIYITLEPCMMCAGAILESKLSKIVFGAYRKNNHHMDLLYDTNINIQGGIMEKECQTLLKSFFEGKR